MKGLEELEELIKWYTNLSWYSGCKDLVVLSVKGGFENNLRGRGTESWDHHYAIYCQDIPEFDLPEIYEIDEDLSKLCIKVLEIAKNYFKEKKY